MKAIREPGPRLVASGRPLPTLTYDAAYLELAQRRMLPLATLDHELRAAARAVGTKTLGEP